MSAEQINVIDRGTGRTVLLVHGFPLDHTLWQYQVDSLSADFRVVCPDLPGFGGSARTGASPLESPLGMDTLADWLQRLLGSLQIREPVVFCGLSMGGYIGWQFALRHPQHLAGLVACHTRAAADSEAISRGRRIAAREVLRQGSTWPIDTLLEKLWPNDLPRGRSPIGRRDRESLRAVIAGTPPESIAVGQLGMASRFDARAMLPTIKVPTLFVAGSEDEITPAEEMQADAERVPGARFTSLDGACHVSPLQDPVRFTEQLKHFLSALPR